MRRTTIERMSRRTGQCESAMEKLGGGSQRHDRKPDDATPMPPGTSGQ